MFKSIKNLDLSLFFLFTFFALLFVFSEIFLNFSDNLKEVHALSSPDAIAIRVVKNPEHFSALHWYREQGFTGSPQSTTVDGYEAIRDGRTVYVNAANIVSGTLYTNIYLISYNQQAEKDTKDIFGRILDHWKFNTNYTAPGNCSESVDLFCLHDTDCPSDEHCLSDKAKIIRDTRRLASLAEIKVALASFRDNHGHYPKLSAGTYLPQMSISTWPSWINVLGQELRIKMPIDPINKLGDCASNYHPVTCWDEVQKSFADADPADPDVNLPPGSRAMVYTSDPLGSSYYACAVMESGYVSGVTMGACASSEVISIDDSIPNRPPYFVDSVFPVGISGEEYNAYLKAVDPDGDEIAWSIDVNPITAWSSWSAPPALLDTIDINQKNINASMAGSDGSYSVSVTLDDGRSAPVTEIFPFTIVNNPPVIESFSCPEVIRWNDPYNCTVSATDPDGHVIVKFEFVPGTYPNGLSINDLGTISGNPLSLGVFNVGIRAIDEFGAVSSVFSIPLTVNSYCGDGILQTPNNENRGGPSNDGREECDGTNELATSPSDSSVDRQYECSTPPICPLTGDCTGFCRFIGGWCGDGTTQGAHGEDCESGGAGTGPNDQWDCTAECQWTGGWCYDGTIQAAYGEDCESAGSGTGPDDQWNCTSGCEWSDGWCGNAICDIFYESALSCPIDCLVVYSNFHMCTDHVEQPACYSGSFSNPRLFWEVTSVQSDYCNCDGTPAFDCPFGFPCAASEQQVYWLQIDNNSDYSSPEYDTGLVNSGNFYHDVAGPGLLPGAVYFWRVRIKDQYDTWSNWAECSGPFATSPSC